MAKVTELSQCQPRFVLYARAKGLQQGDTWHTWEYMAWIDNMVKGYRVARSMKPLQPIEDHDDFTRWIQQEVTTA